MMDVVRVKTLAAISIPIDKVRAYEKAEALEGEMNWEPQATDWARFGDCPECESEGLIPLDDYLCIKCRVIG